MCKISAPLHERIIQASPEQQRLLALELATRVRTHRALLRERLRSGELAAAEVVLRGSRETDTMTVGALLVSQPGWGARRSSAILDSVSLSETKPLGALTGRQRVMLAAKLGREARGLPRSPWNFADGGPEVIVTQ